MDRDKILLTPGPLTRLGGFSLLWNGLLYWETGVRANMLSGRSWRTS